MLEKNFKDIYNARFYTLSYKMCKDFYFLLDVKFDKVNGVRKVGQEHWVMVHACRVCHGQILCKVS